MGLSKDERECRFLHCQDNLRPLAGSVNQQPDETSRFHLMVRFLLFVQTEPMAGLRRSTTTGEINGACLLEATPIRMVTKEARTKTYDRIPASFGVFHQAN